ncbi:hypothetical protein AAFC00_001500 [Neodothiora populina]|uniref:Magnesium transporter n=1 Tax=Neodothiora populina TaxID=2781224 RepID=A0ABR3PP53_9PEZI
MKAVGGLGHLPAPSPAVLRFLRIQADSLSFLASQKRVVAAAPPTKTTCWTRTRAASTLCGTAGAGARNATDGVKITSRFGAGHEVPTTTRRSRNTSELQSQGAAGIFKRGLSSCADNRNSRKGFSATANSIRTFTTSTKENRTFRPWQRMRQKSAGPLQPNDLPPAGPSLLDDSSSLSRITPINELRLRCTEFDENGNVTLVNGAFKKSELIAKYGLLPRDLRKIDSSTLPHILVRSSAILINLLHIRCLIKHNRVLVFDAYGTTDSHTQSLFMYDLEGKLQLREGRAAGSLPYEFRALEAVLISVTAGLEGEFEGVRVPVVKVLRELEEDIDRDKLRHLLIYSKKLGTFEQKARLVRDAIDDLLEADDDLASMYLSEKAAGIKRGEDDHQEVEMLLESYHKVCDEIVQVSGNLVSNIRNTEEIVKAILDANRNSLMLLDLKFTILTLGIGVGTFFAGLYGMNLKNFIEETDFGFPLVSVSCGVFAVAAIVYGLRKLRKVQRLSMWGEGGSLDQGGVGKGRGGRGSWREVDPQGQLAGERKVSSSPKWKPASASASAAAANAHHHSHLHAQHQRRMGGMHDEADAAAAAATSTPAGASGAGLGTSSTVDRL